LAAHPITAASDERYVVSKAALLEGVLRLKISEAKADARVFHRRSDRVTNAAPMQRLTPRGATESVRTSARRASCIGRRELAVKQVTRQWALR
jgi:hypothetical protein